MIIKGKAERSIDTIAMMLKILNKKITKQKLKLATMLVFETLNLILTLTYSESMTLMTSAKIMRLQMHSLEEARVMRSLVSLHISRIKQLRTFSSNPRDPNMIYLRVVWFKLKR